MESRLEESCYYCSFPVKVAPGQRVHSVVETEKDKDGNIIAEIEYPLHKKCRKENE